MADRPCIQVHQAMIYDRGGERRLWTLGDISSVRWTRSLDKQSTADLTINGEACRDQAATLAQIEPRRHELVLFRNGERVWEGPIVQMQWLRDEAKIIAHDVTEYLRYTPLTKDWPNEDGGGPPLMTDRIVQIITHELTTPYDMQTNTALVTVPRWENLDPPANVLPHLEVRPGTVLTRSMTEAFEMSLFEHIQNLARSGVEFTTIGRKILFWDRANVIGQTRTLTDNDFYGGGIEVFASGSDHYSIAHVVTTPAPAEDDGDPNTEPVEPPLAVGNAGGPHDYYGVWTHVTTTENEEGTDSPTQTELNGQAGRELVGRTPVPLEIRVPTGSGLMPSFDLTIADLVPGVQVPVLATLNLRPVSQLQRIEEVSVTEDSSTESVGITLIPAGDVTGAAGTDL